METFLMVNGPINSIVVSDHLYNTSGTNNVSEWRNYCQVNYGFIKRIQEVSKIRGIETGDVGVWRIKNKK